MVQWHHSWKGYGSIAMQDRKPTGSIKKLLSLFVVLAAVFALILVGRQMPSFSGEPAAPAMATAEISTSPSPEVSTMTLSVVGDIMAHGPQNRDAYNASTGTYDYSSSLQYVKKQLQSADLAVGNLETTFAGGPDYSGYPRFNTPAALAGNLKSIGIDLLSTANNHAMDRGYDGLVSTLKTLDAAGISHVGTYAAAEDRAKDHGIVVKTVSGISIAFLSYTYGTNGFPIPAGREFCINVAYTDYLTDCSVVDRDKMVSDLAAAKALNPDLICVFMHWGTEYHLQPTEAQETLADLLFENGADIILGGHPHVLEPMETRTVTTADGETKRGFVCFSLGNFISSQNDEYTDTSVILNLKITKDWTSGKTEITDISYVPLLMLDREKGPQRYLLLDARAAMADYEAGRGGVVTGAVYQKLKKAVSDCAAILGDGWQLPEKAENAA